MDRRRGAFRAMAAAAGALLMAACSTPMPRAMPPTQMQPVSPPMPAPSTSAGLSRLAPPPVRPSAPPIDPPATPPVVSIAAVSPAVAARFPEPSVSFATPAFGSGRSAFTTNDELRDVLGGLSRGGARGGGTAIELLPIGVSQRGVPIEALAFSRPYVPPALAPAAPGAVASPLGRRPVVLVIGGQHGDEPAPTEALIVAAQQLASGRFDRVLDVVDVILVPRANPDGAALATRDTADGTDLNRDHLVLATPEAQALAQLVRDAQPIVVLDLHEYPVDAALWGAKFGGVQRFDALLQYAAGPNQARFVTKAAEEWFRAPLAASLGSAGYSSDWYHTVSADPADRKVSMGGAGAEIARNAEGLKNAVSLLVETRGGNLGRTDIKRRVQAQLLALGSVLDSAAQRAGDVVKLRQFVERDVSAMACQGEGVIEAGLTPSEYALPLLDAQTGAVKRVTVSWESALELRVVKSRPRACGYWLAASEAEAARRLRLLGVEVQQVEAAGEQRGETYRETGREAMPGGGTRLRVQTQPVLLDIPAGSFWISLEQPLAGLAIAALEPESPSGYVARGVIGSASGVARVLARPELRATPLP